MPIESSYFSVRERIETACAKAGRSSSDISLIAVSKTRTIDEIASLYSLGHRDFGENRLQEAIPKITALPKDITWHFIGTLQSNKARRIASVFPFIHTFSKESQIEEAEKAKTTVQAFIEVNIADEPQKSGVSLEKLDEFHAMLLQSSYVHFRGLMTIGPAGASADQMRSYFREIKRLTDQFGAKSISMGMSGDFEMALMEGATHIRVGTAIFGSRD